jgi:HAD superfamily hydrolase (TIGR01509 family)
MNATPLMDLLARKRLLIFDLDGTLVDSSPLHARAFTQAFAPFGIAVDYAKIAGLTTESAVDLIANRANLVLTREERRALVQCKRDLALALIKAELKPIPGAPAFVQAAGRRWSRALCTSASRTNADAALRKAGLDGCFNWIVTANDITRGKPDPEIFLAALHQTGIAAADALVFEDAPSGLAAAAAAGIDAIEVVVDRARPGSSQANWSMLIDALGTPA